KTNTAHLIEHLMFGPYSPKEPAYFTQAKTKGRVNANTRHLATVYSTETAAENLEFFLKLEAKRLMQTPNWKLDDVKREANVIKTEHARNYTQLPYILWRDFFATAFAGHPIGWHTSGIAEHLDKISAVDVHSFFKSH